MSLEIVRVRSGEIKELAALAKEIWNQHFPSIIGQAQVDYMIGKFQSEEAMTRQLDDGYEYYFLKSEQKNVGYFAVQPQDDGSLFLSKLYIRLESRGRGLARNAFEFMKEMCREKGYKSIWLTVNRHNSDTIAVYERFGMKVKREQVCDIGYGFVMDDYVFEYEL